MNIGYAQNIITPSLERPVYLAGFGQNRRAETVHDDLYARALAIGDSSRTIVLCALDLIGFFRRDVYEVIQRVHKKWPEVDILIASLHPHHGPDTMGLWGPDSRTSGVDPLYMSELKDKIVAVILSALENMQPAAGIKVTSISVPGLTKNARNPEILDNELTLFQFLNADNRPLVTGFNFPCHPEVLWEHNPHITADYVGYLRCEVEQQSGAPCIFFVGALGGMMTPNVKDHSFEEAEFMGKTLAQKGLAALQDANREPVVTLSIQKKEISVKLTNLLFKLAIRRGLFPDIRDPKGRIQTEVSLVKIGSLWLAAVPGELLPKLGLAIKANLLAAGAGRAGIIGLANDELGYILPKEDFRYPLNPLKPGKHYEESMSIGKEIGTTIMQSIHELIGS